MERWITEIVPGGWSPVTGVYELRDKSGLPTITRLFILEGSQAPAAPPGFKWQLIELTRKRWWVKPPGQGEAG